MAEGVLMTAAFLRRARDASIAKLKYLDEELLSLAVVWAQADDVKHAGFAERALASLRTLALAVGREVDRTVRLSHAVNVAGNREYWREKAREETT